MQRKTNSIVRDYLLKLEDYQLHCHYRNQAHSDVAGNLSYRGCRLNSERSHDEASIADVVAGEVRPAAAAAVVTSGLMVDVVRALVSLVVSPLSSVATDCSRAVG